MIAAAAYPHLLAGDLASPDLNAEPNLRLALVAFAFQRRVTFRNTTSQEAAACKNMKVGKYLTELYSGDPKLAGVHGDPSRQTSSRLLKNCVGQAISVLACVIFECWRFFASFFRAAERPMWSFQRRCRDTTARTYCAGTAAAIRFRMRTRL